MICKEVARKIFRQRRRFLSSSPKFPTFEQENMISKEVARKILRQRRRFLISSPKFPTFEQVLKHSVYVLCFY